MNDSRDQRQAGGPQQQPPYVQQQQYSQQPPPYGPQPPVNGQQPPAPAAYGAAQPPMSASDERMWATLGHAGACLFGFLAPLVVYLVYKDRSAFVRRHAAEALNFQIIMAAAYVAGIVLTLILIGPLIMLAAWVATLIFAIMSAIAANAGQNSRYPFNIGILK